MCDQKVTNYSDTGIGDDLVNKLKLQDGVWVMHMPIDITKIAGEAFLIR